MYRFDDRHTGSHRINICTLIRQEIGNKQMSDMGNKLGKLKRTKTLGDYTLIAVLHHHVVKFLPKDYDDQNWIKNILYMKIHSA